MPKLVDEIIYLPYWELGTAAFLRAALSRLPFRRRAEAAFLAYPAARPIYLALLAFIPARRRFAHRYAPSWIRRAAGISIEQVPIGAVHNVLRDLDLLKAAGFEPEVPSQYVLPSSWISVLPRSDTRVVMHIGTIAHNGLESRRWPETHFADLARRLMKRGFEVSLLIGPAERDETLRVHREAPGSSLFEGSMAEVARFISESAGVVANDSGIAHLAAGCGTPVFAIMGPTPVEHGPYGLTAIAYRPSLCPPCFDIVHTDSSCKLNIDFACLKSDVRVDEVEREFVALLAESSNPIKHTAIEHN